MATAKAGGDEPSIEEILASIREIISDDTFEGQKPAPSAQVTHAVPEPEADDILDLDSPVEDIEKPEPVAELPDFSVSKDDSLDFTDELIALLDDPKPEEAHVDVQPAMPAATTASLIDETVREAAAAQLSRLTANIGINRAGHSGMTLEDMVRDMITPMLKEWLDANLPKVIERVVEREIKQIVARS